MDELIYDTFDMDAARREEECPDGIKIVYKGEEFILPAELPIDIFDALLSDDLDLTGIFTELLNSEDEDVMKAVLKLLIDRPTLPKAMLDAIHACFRSLFGDEDYPRFRGLRPSIKDVVRLARGLFERYGTSLGEAFASPDSSGDGGATSSQPSSSTEDSTLGTSGADAPATVDAPAPASSE